MITVESHSIETGLISRMRGHSSLSFLSIIYLFMGVNPYAGSNSSKTFELKEIYSGPFISIKEFLEIEKSTQEADRSSLIRKLKFEDRIKLYTLPLDMSWKEKMNSMKLYA